MYRNLVIALSLLLIFAALLTGCGTGGYVQAASAQNEQKQADSKPVVSPDEDKQIKKLISDYFIKMYSEPVLNYQSNSETGRIPDHLKKFLAKRTLEEGDNNIEAGLNYPRFVGMNGETIIAYSPLMKPGEKEQPQLEATCIEENNGKLLYFVKINLKADCISDEIFERNYELNEAAQTYKKIPEVEPQKEEIDTILVQTRYDVELVKEADGYRIVRARESTFKQGARNRLFRYNNDFMTRIPYVNIEKEADKKSFINKEDGNVYTSEREKIITFFENILKLDGERRTLLSGSWDEGYEKFDKLVKSIGVNKDKDKKEIFTLNVDYREKFPKEALIIDGGIERLEVKDEIKVDMHPAYSRLKKWYIVRFSATVDKSGDALTDQQYDFDFLVKLTGTDSNLKIDSIKLNDASAAPETVTEQKTE